MRDKERENLVFKIRLVHRKSRKTYGSPRITAELHASGLRCSENRVARLMRKNGIMAKTKRKFKITTDSKHNLPIAPNILDQKFVADAPNRTWTGDITYIWTRQCWMYLAVVLDLFNREIAGWSMRRRITKDIVTETLTTAIQRKRPQAGLIFHSDRGSQYASHEIRKLLEKHHFIQSMSGKGNCYEREACPWGIMLLLKAFFIH